jgi:hypothetical protein
MVDSGRDRLFWRVVAVCVGRVEAVLVELSVVEQRCHAVMEVAFRAPAIQVADRLVRPQRR